jgi:hypothetical protein
MISIARSGNDWIVVQNGEPVSVHPTRGEAERCAFWLLRKYDGQFEELTRQAKNDRASRDG